MMDWAPLPFENGNDIIQDNSLGGGGRAGGTAL